jgi:molybdopterin/thiamine biosynthesis adenylyltransferase
MKIIDPNIFMKGKKRKPTVCFPSPIKNENIELWGYHFDETNYYNVIATSEPSAEMGGVKPVVVGRFYAEKPQNAPVGELVGYYEGEEIVFEIDGVAAELEPVKLKMDIFSRNTGILESDIMLKKGALIIGCGSVGSLVALELARAGVGRFFLIDMDILSYHNICRHQCGIQDVGKFKTTAVKERILQINPMAEVHTSNKMIQEVDKSLLEEFCNKDAIMVGCADNREGDLYGNLHLAKPNGMPFISIGCWERAFAGEIFYCLPEGMPDYSDFVAALGESSGRVNANTHVYMGEVGSFEPGISADINFVTTIAVKMILDLLNRDNEAYTQRLIQDLTQYTLICNTNNPKIGGEMAEIFSYPLQVTRSIEIDYASSHSEETNQP